MDDRLQREFAQARRHVIQGGHIVERQRALVARMRADGHSTAAHEQLLELFERTLSALEDHERLLLSEIAEEETRASAHGT